MLNDDAKQEWRDGNGMSDLVAAPQIIFYPCMINRSFKVNEKLKCKESEGMW